MGLNFEVHFIAVFQVIVMVIFVLLQIFFLFQILLKITSG